MTAISTSVAAPSGWEHAWRSRGSACPLASSPISIIAIAALATGGEIITLHAADDRRPARNLDPARHGQCPVDVQQGCAHAIDASATVDKGYLRRSRSSR